MITVELLRVRTVSKVGDRHRRDGQREIRPHVGGETTREESRFTSEITVIRTLIYYAIVGESHDVSVR